MIKPAKSLFTWKARSFYFLFSLAVIYSIYVTTRGFLGEVSALQVGSRLEQWGSEQGLETTLSPKEWHIALAEAEKALRYNPSPANYYIQLGALHEWRQSIDYENLAPTAENRHRQLAIEAYRRSISLRPAWPDGWIHLARQKALVNERDDELHFAMTRALTLGNNEPRIQALAIEVIALSWPFFADNDEINRLIAE